MSTPNYRVSERLKHYKHEVVEAWVEMVRNRIAIAAQTDRTRLIDNVPQFIEELAFAVQRENSGDVVDASGISERHALQRATQTELTELDMIEEYQLLRSIILETLWHFEPLGFQEVKAINEAVDQAIVRSVRVYERLKAETRNREQLLANIFLRSNTGPFVILDYTWKFIYLNQAALQESGKRDKSDILGKSIWDLYPENMSGMMQKNLRLSMTKRKPVQFETYMQNIDKWYAVECFPNEIGLALYFRDISDRIAAENELKHQKSLLEAVIEKMPAGVQIVEAETGRVLISNNEMDQMVGKYQGSNYWKDISKTEILHDDYEAFATYEYPAVRALNGEVVKDEEMIYRRPDGSTTYFLTSSSPLRNQKGQVTHVVTVCTDIGEIKRIQEKLSESNRDLSIYSATVAHDLKSPVHTMVSMTEMLALKNADRFDEESQEFMRFIISASKRMQKLIDNLLSYARINEEREPFKMVDLNCVLEDVLNNLKEPIQKSDAHIFFTDLPRVQGDEIQLVSLFQNLVANAIKFQSHSRPTIMIRALEKENCYHLEVHDNGIGFDSEKAKHLFEPFTRLHTQDSYEGTGLGLAICKRIVERHKGRIWVDSFPGQGTKFFIEIPKR